MMKRLLASLLVLQACAASAQTVAPPNPSVDAPSGAPDYIRFVEADEGAGLPVADRLQTAVVRFEKGGESVDLVGVVHLGDAAYYAELNERLKGYDAVLYEMVGGPHRPGAGPADGAAGEVESLRQLQQLAKSFLRLEFQLDAIDYTPSAFVHADVAWEEMDELMKARNESIMTLFTRASTLAENGEVAGVPSDAAAMETMMKRVLGAVLTGNSAELKRSVAPFLSEAESFIEQLEGEDGTVLVGERNRVVMETLAAVRQERGRGRYAIFYGAGHMPDFERRLLAEGFAKGTVAWLDAWSIPVGAPASPGASPVEGILRLLSENPETAKGLRELGTMLEDLGSTLKALSPPSGQ